jgi:hypothetical protein
MSIKHPANGGRAATRASSPDKIILSERLIGQAPLSGYWTTRTIIRTNPKRWKAPPINGLENTDNCGQLRTNAIGARRTVVVCPYRADNCPAPNLVLLGMASIDRLAASLILLEEVFLGGAEDHVVAAGPAPDRHHVIVDIDYVGLHQILSCPLECFADGVSLEELAIPPS